MFLELKRAIAQLTGKMLRVRMNRLMMSLSGISGIEAFVADIAYIRNGGRVLIGMSIQFKIRGETLVAYTASITSGKLGIHFHRYDGEFT